MDQPPQHAAIQTTREIRSRAGRWGGLRQSRTRRLRGLGASQACSFDRPCRSDLGLSAVDEQFDAGDEAGGV
jgi:hypothetical protein